MLPFLIEQSCGAFVVRPFHVSVPECDITRPDLSAYRDANYIIYHKTGGKVYVTPPFPWLLWHQGNCTLIMSPAGCLTVKSSRINFFNKLLKCENNSLQSRNALALQYKV